MEDFKKNTACGNIAGFKRIEITSCKEVHSIIPVSYNRKKVLFNNGGRFGIIDSRKIDLNIQFDDGFYNIAISCEFAGIKTAYDSKFNGMTRDGFIAKITDNNNVVWVAGTIEEPLRFRFTHKGTPLTTGVHNYSLFFYRNTTESLCLLDE